MRHGLLADGRLRRLRRQIFCDDGGIELRDRRQPLVPYHLLAETGTQTRIQAQEKVGLTAYTGRDAELVTLRRCLDAMRAGVGHLVTVTGEPGMGKSRLLHELRQGVDESVLAVLTGRCQPYGGDVAYLPFIEILLGFHGGRYHMTGTTRHDFDPTKLCRWPRPFSD